MDVVRRLDLTQDPSAAGLARVFVRKCCREWAVQDPEGVALLVVSELVTNALQHATGPLTLFVARRLDKIVISVRDGSDLTTAPRHAAELETSGRGLELVASLSSAWGEQQTEDGKRVWAEVAAIQP